MALKSSIGKKPESPNPISEVMGSKDLEPVLPTARRGRPNGKRSSGEYVTTTLILRRDLKLDAQDKARRSGRDLSDVVNELLENFINT